MSINEIKKKIAALLRRLASKLDGGYGRFDWISLPSSSPLVFSHYSIRRLSKSILIPHGEQLKILKREQLGFRGFREKVMFDYRKDITQSIVMGLFENDIIDFEERTNPETLETIISGTLYVGFPIDRKEWKVKVE